jgi:hypothetical protein
MAVNAVINHPSVRPFVGFAEAGELDASPLIRPENLFPFGEHGGFALLWTAPFTAEVHTFILPEGRGAWAKDAALAGIALAREAGFALLWTKIPPEAPHVLAFAVAMGMRPTGEAVDDHHVYAMGTGACQ